MDVKNNNNLNIYYAMISNIPSSYHSLDLRNYFSQFIEAGKFDCFHYRHRPEIKKNKDTEIENNSCNDMKQTKCCITKVNKRNFDELIKLYNRKHWIDRKEESLSTLCCISVVKISKSSPEISDKYKRSSERQLKSALDASDLDSLMELKPPKLMPCGNVGTPIHWFLEEIQACRLPPSVIKKLDLVFPATRKFRKYGEVYFDYSLFELDYNEESECYNDDGMPSSNDAAPLTAITSKGVELEDENEYIKLNAESEIVINKSTVKMSELEEEACEDWERHEALHDDVTNKERNKEREFECDMEVTWEKGGSGLVFYTDAAYWAKEKGDFDEQTADDWDVDMSIYEHTQFDATVKSGAVNHHRLNASLRATGDISSSHCSTGDMDSRAFLSIRKMQRLKDGKDDGNICGDFERYTKGIGKRYMKLHGWNEGQGIGKNDDGINDTIDNNGQNNKYGLGYYGEKLIRNRSELDKPTYDEDKLYQRPHPHTLKYRQKFYKSNSAIK